MTVTSRLDGAFVPCPAPDVDAVVVGGELVLRRGAALHLLNPSAALVWQCCDGTASVGEVAADLADGLGADATALLEDVLAAVEDLVARRLLVGRGEHATVDAAPLVIADPRGSCASCEEAAPRRQRTTLRIADQLVVVGSDDVAVDRAIRDAFGAAVVAPEDEPPALAEARPYWSLTLSPRVERGAVQPLHLLLRGPSVVVRSRSARRVLLALAGHVAAQVDPLGDGLVAFPGVVVGTPAGVAVAPRPGPRVAFERGLARHGLQVADGPLVVLDPVRGEVVVGAPGLAVDPAPLEALAAECADLGSEPPPLAWGRYPIAALALPDEPRTPLRALLALAPDAERRDAPQAADALSALVATRPLVGAAPAAIAAALGV